MLYEEIERYVDAHKDEAVSFLTDFLRIPSPTGKEKAAALFVRDKLASEGFDVSLPALDPERPNVLCDWKGAPGRTLLFNGHLDVFPPEGSPKRAPWAGSLENGRLYARGATDMKSGDAAGILAMVFLKRMGFEPKGMLSLGLNCDEESGSKNGILYCISKGLMKADFTICMEASENTIITETDARVAWKVTFCAEGWHAGTRLDKTDALEMAVGACQAVRAYDQKLRKERYFEDSGSGAMVSVTSLDAGGRGRTVNMHPALCEMWIDRRITNGETEPGAKAELEALLNAVPGLAGHFSIETLYVGAKMQLDAGDPDIQGCMRAYEEVFKKPITPGRRCAGSDGAKLFEAYGRPVPQLGPGVFSVLGTDDEYVETSEFLGFIKVYMLFASRFLA